MTADVRDHYSYYIICGTIHCVTVLLVINTPIFILSTSFAMQIDNVIDSIKLLINKLCNTDMNAATYER